MLVFFSLIISLSFSKSASGQIVIWSEDFDGYENGTNTGVGSSGSVTSWIAAGYRQESNSTIAYGVTVIDNQLRGRYTSYNNPDYNTWEIDPGNPIEISGFSFVSISVDISAAGDMENNDYIRLEYNIDGSGWNTFETNGYIEDNFGSATAIQNNLSGNSLRLRITMVNSQNSESYYADNIVVTGSDAPDYCVPDYTTGTGEGDFISLVRLESINNTTGALPNPYYNFYSNISTSLEIGGAYNITLGVGTYPTQNNIAAWIDFNQDGDFNDSGEKLGELNSLSGSSTGVINFIVPAIAISGITRLRVRESWTTTGMDACTNYIYGETEDYNVNLLPPCAVTAYNVTGGGEYCAGDGGVAVGLDDSETGVTYELYLNSSATGNIVSGTGAAISFGNQSAAGTYTVVGTHNTDACEVSMNGNATVTVNPVPSAPTIGTVTQPSCTEATGNVVLNGLPSSGTWIVTQNPGSTTTLGTGTSTTITGLAENDYTFTVALINSGNGLSAEYFNNMTLSGTPALTKTDATVGFNWGNGGPGAPIGNDNFSVRWSGKILPLYSENYTFTTNSDDGIRLWVNGTQVINNWTDHAATINTGTIDLSAGQLYDIVLEFYENGGQAVAELSWSSASQALEIIPQSQLYPTGTISSGCPSPFSSTFTINAQPVAPLITTQPSANDESYCLNEPANSLSVNAVGDGLNYQWFSNTSPSTSGGATVGSDSPSYTPLTTSAGTLYYYVVVSGNCAPDAISSVSGAITVNSLPIATISSNNGSVCEGDEVIFTFSGTSGATVAYTINDGTNETVELTGGTAQKNMVNVTEDLILKLVSVDDGTCSRNLSETTTVVVNPLPNTGDIIPD